MRRTALTCLGFASLALATIAPGCGEPASGEHVIRAAQPIQGGSVDQTDTAVVAILINTSQGMSLCSGSLIAPNLVLSAHHCVANNTSTSCSSNGFGSVYPTSDFRVTTSYNAAAQVFNGSANLPNPDGVTWFGVSSVTVPGNNICGQDMSALTLSQKVPTICPLIPAVDVAVTSGEAYTAIGFGITSPNGQTAGTRYKVSGMSVQCPSNCSPGQDSPTMEWEGGASSAKGTCEGDSGGPAIDGSGRVIGTVSRGPAGACNSTVYESVYGESAWIKQVAQQAATAGGYGAAGWVTGGATSNPANGYCGGGSSSSSTSSTSTSSSSSTSSTSSSSSSSSSGGGVPTSCSGADGNIGCCTSGGVLYYCSGTTLHHGTCPSGTVCGWDTTNNYYNCVAPPGGADPSNMYPLYCGGTTSSSSSSSGGTSTSSSSSTSSTSTSSGGNQCAGAMPTGDANCDPCLDNSCCDQLVACSNDTTCNSCASSANPPASCNTNQLLNDLYSCISGSCASQCGGGSSSSSSSGTASSSSGAASSSGGTGGSSSGGGSSSSGIFGNGGSGAGGGSGNGASGAGGSGAGNSGTGATHGGLGNPGTSSGCNVASSGSGTDSSPASLAGLLLGAALVFSRRRR